MQHLESSEIRKKYDESADSYSKKESMEFWLNPSFKRACNILEETDAGIFVDIGCGSGCLVDALSRQFKDVMFYGFDISENMINLAKERCRDSENVAFFIKDISSEKDMITDLLNKDKNTIISCVGTLAYFDDKSEFSKSLLEFTSRLNVAGWLVTAHNANFVAYRLNGREIAAPKKNWLPIELLSFLPLHPVKKLEFTHFYPLELLISYGIGRGGYIMGIADKIFGMLFGWIGGGLLFPNFLLSSWSRKTANK